MRRNWFALLQVDLRRRVVLIAGNHCAVLEHRQIELDRLLIHTDQGSQYRATACRQLLENHKISCSMSAKGCCSDNAVMESFFSALKHELGLDNDSEILNSPLPLIRHLDFWIDGYHNRERRHSTIR